MCTYMHKVQRMALAFSYSTNLNSKGDTVRKKTRNKEGRPLQENKELFHEVSLPSATWKQEILGKQYLLEQTGTAHH